MKLRTVNMKQYNERKYLIVDENGLPIPRLCEFTLTHLYGAEKTQENNAYLFTRTGLTASVLPGWDNLSSRCTP